jgi:small subunit ribosomal protein S19
MSRSLKKAPYTSPKLLNKLKKIKAESNVVVKTWSRVSIIRPEMVGFTFGVHNGHEHIKVKVSDDMVGHRLGEFSPTKTWKGHGGRKAREEAAAEKSAEKTTSKT